jgi:hypothetical protein
MASTTYLDSKIKRLQGEINQLENQRSKATRDESEAIKKINRANSSINRTKNITTIKNKGKEIEKENEKIQKSKAKQADLLTKISKKNMDLNNAINELGMAQRKEQDKIYQDQERKLQEFKIMQAANKANINLDDDLAKEYDIFISHSADDKDSFVNDLAVALKDAGVDIWYDSDSIGWGQSIRQEIDKGLAYSKFGIVVISPSFIEKHWTNYELDGILNKEGSTNVQMILPIWHNITADQVQKYSYSLANKLALNTALNTIEEIVESVKKMIMK